MNSVSNDTPPVDKDSVCADINQQKNRRSLLLMLAVFALPIILAKFALDGEWLETGVTNKGTLLTDGLTLEKLGVEHEAFEQQWLILYSLPKNCNGDCQKALEAVHNTYVALGKEMPRVTPVALYQSELSMEQLKQISKSQWQLLSMPSQAKELIVSSQVLIVDPLGNVFLSHQVPDAVDKLPQFGKQILADMKKLLKYSKVG
ncbi:MAG: hypothetical protein OQK09_12805 [Colwellia sp.]|nr:hypothetical protein [Colwellia sp.]MCW8864246.1 hypothetical protein [Colwellia sp.]MCW9082385.1 hypothetical protein [Colwellia sp.]